MPDLICPVCDKSIWFLTRVTNPDGVITHMACQHDYKAKLNPDEPALSEPSTVPTPGRPEVEKSDVALWLAIFAWLQLIASPIAGLMLGIEQSAFFGISAFVGGLFSGLVLLGFSKVVEHLYEAAQRLGRIEASIQATGGVMADELNN